MMNRLYKLAIWCGGIVLTLIVCIIIAYIAALTWLGSESGRLWLAEQIEHYGSTDEYQLSVGVITVFDSRHLVLSSLAISDNAGEFIALHDIAIDYHPGALLFGRVAIGHLTIQDLQWQRLPVPGEVADQPAAAVSLPDIAIRNIDIAKLTLAPALLDTTVPMVVQQLTANVMLSGSRLALTANTGMVTIADDDILSSAISDVAITTDITWDDEQLSIHHSRFHAAWLIVDVSGPIRFNPFTLNLDITATINDLVALDPELGGQLQATSTLHGSDEPLVFNATVDVNAKDLTTPWPIVDDLLGATPGANVTLTYSDERLTFTDGVLSAHALQDTTFSGVVDGDTVELQLATHYQDIAAQTLLLWQGDQLAWQQLVVTSPYGSATGNGALQLDELTVQADLHYQWDDMLHATAAISGAVDQLNVTGLVQGDGALPYRLDYHMVLTPQNEPLLTLTTLTGELGVGDRITLLHPVELYVDQDIIHLGQLALGINDGQLSVSGTLGPERFATNWQLDLPAHWQTWPQFTSGSIAGEGFLRGLYTDPLGELTLTLDNITAARLDNKVDTAFNGTANADYRDQQLTLDIDLTGPANGRWQMHGMLPVAPTPLQIRVDQPLSAQLQATLNWEAVAALFGFDEHRITGQSQLDAQISGSWREPVIRGEASWRQGSYENLLTGTYLDDITAALQAQNNTIQLTQLTARDRYNGRLSVSGELILHDDLQYSLLLDANRLRLIDLDNIQLTASGDLTMRGTDTAAQLAGDIKINEADYTISNVISSDPLDGFQIINVNQPQPVAEQSTIPPIDLTVTIDASNRLFIRGPDLETEWGAQLAVSGSTEQPELSGEMTLLRGYWQLLGIPVNFSDGEIRFVNPDPTNPALAIRGVMRGREVDATLDITGTAQAPTISLSSEPPLPEDEILAKTLFGTTANQLTAAQALRIAQLLAYLSGSQAASFDPLARIRRTIGVDTLSVGLDESGAATVSAGKYINNRIYIGVDQGTAAESSAIRAVIDITDHVEVETVTGSTDENSIGVNWKYDY